MERQRSASRDQKPRRNETNVSPARSERQERNNPPVQRASRPNDPVAGLDRYRQNDLYERSSI